MKKDTTERRQNGLNLVSSDLRAMARSVLGKRGFSCVDLIACWEDVVGTQLAGGVRPDKISYPRAQRTGGTLHVKVLGGAFAIMVEHQKKILLEKINTFLGYAAISDIKIVQGIPFYKPIQKSQSSHRSLTTEEENTLRRKVADIEDPALKEAVYRLGKTIFLK